MRKSVVNNILELNLENHEGREYPTNEGDIAVVVEYINYENVYVRFMDQNTPAGFTRKCQLGDLRRGRVKNPYKRQHFGVGFKGDGPHLMAEGGKNTRVYNVWSNMLRRCYEKTSPSYKNYGLKGVTVCEEWHNFQNFAEWYKENYTSGFELDKDLLKEGNLLYCAEFCRFLPKEINSFVKRDSETTGVWFDGTRFVAQISIGNSNRGLGRYGTLEQAREKFLGAKVQRAKMLAEKYRTSIPEECYNALINYGERYG